MQSTDPWRESVYVIAPPWCPQLLVLPAWVVELPMARSDGPRWEPDAPSERGS